MKQLILFMLFFIFQIVNVYSSETVTPTPDIYQQTIKVGNKYFQIKYYDSAIKKYQSAVDINKNRYEAFLGWARCLVEKNQFELARTQLEQAKSKSSFNLEVRKGFEEYFLKIGRLEDLRNTYI